MPGDAQLITVPCCEACRRRDQSNDELVRNVLVSLEDIESVDYVAKHVVPRRDRALARSQSQVLKVAGLMQTKTVKDMHGKIVREDPAFDLDNPHVTQFLERIGRALLFKEFNRSYFEAAFDWRLNPPIPAEVYQHAVATYPKRRILDVIAYVVSPMASNVDWIIVQFYGGVEFLLRFESRRETTLRRRRRIGLGAMLLLGLYSAYEVVFYAWLSATPLSPSDFERARYHYNGWLISLGFSVVAAVVLALWGRRR